MPLWGLIAFLLLCRCSRRLQWHNLRLWADIVREDTHYGGTVAKLNQLGSSSGILCTACLNKPTSWNTELWGAYKYIDKAFSAFHVIVLFSMGSLFGFFFQSPLQCLAKLMNGEWEVPTMAFPYLSWQLSRVYHCEEVEWDSLIHREYSNMDTVPLRAGLCRFMPWLLVFSFVLISWECHPHTLWHRWMNWCVWKRLLWRRRISAPGDWGPKSVPISATGSATVSFFFFCMSFCFVLVCFSPTALAEPCIYSSPFP